MVFRTTIQPIQTRVLISFIEVLVLSGYIGMDVLSVIVIISLNQVQCFPLAPKHRLRFYDTTGCLSVLLGYERNEPASVAKRPACLSRGLVIVSIYWVV